MPDYASFVEHRVDDAVYNQHQQDDAVFAQHHEDHAAVIQHPPYDADLAQHPPYDADITQHPPYDADLIQHLPYDANSMHTHHAPTFLYRSHEQATYDQDPYIHNCQQMPCYSNHQMSYYNYTSGYEEVWRPSTYYRERPSFQTSHPDFHDRWLRDNDPNEKSRHSTDIPVFTSQYGSSMRSTQGTPEKRYITEEHLQQYYKDTLEKDLQQLEEKVLSLLKAWRDEDLHQQEDGNCCEKLHHSIICLTCYEDGQFRPTTDLNIKGLRLLATTQSQAERA